MCYIYNQYKRKFYQLFFSHNFDRLSIYDTKVDRVSANYNGYYRQESGKSDKYGFSGACLRNFNSALLFSTFIFYGPVEEQQLFNRYLFVVAMGERGVYDSLSPTEKLCVFLRCLRGVPYG